MNQLAPFEPEATRKGIRRAGVWLAVIIVVAAVLPVIALIVPRFTTERVATIGDGTDAGSYGFALGRLRVDRTGLSGAGVPRDFTLVLDDPETIAAADVAARNKLVRRERRRKFLVSSDRVIGVVVDGEARAYPLRVVASHEIVNDTLAARPIAVVYCPRTESIVVLDRLIAREPTQTVHDAPPQDSEGGVVAHSATSARIVRFGFSGLVYNNVQVLYDRPPMEPARYAGPVGHGGDTVTGERLVPPTALPEASLWSPLLPDAIAGPAVKARERLHALPCTVEPWARFYSRHPDATVITGLAENEASYDDTYAHAATASKIVFPLSRDPDDAFPPRSRLVAVAVDGWWVAYPLPALRERAGDGGATQIEQAEVTIEFTLVPGVAGEVDTITASPVSGLADRDFAVAYSSWFAWRAIVPDARVWKP